MGIVFRVLDSLDGILQFCDGVDNRVRSSDRGLHYILVLEENCVGQSFCSCLFAKHDMCSVVLRGRFQIESIC